VAEAREPKCAMVRRFAMKDAKADFEMTELDIAPDSGSGDRGFKSFPPSQFNSCFGVKDGGHPFHVLARVISACHRAESGHPVDCLDSGLVTVWSLRLLPAATRSSWLITRRHLVRVQGGPPKFP
jgi:hypothetical protein